MFITIIRRMAIFFIATLILSASFIVYVSNGYYFKEERKYDRQITITTEQFGQIMGDNELDYWKNSNGLYDIDVNAYIIGECITNEVSKKMTFAYRNNLSEMRGNCEGQAMLCSAVLNRVFKELDFKSCYAEPVIGQVYFYDINVNKILMRIVPKKYKNFVVNHCVVKIYCNNGEEIYCDPSIDYIGWDINRKL